ncbi:MAG: pentapeptide repeat-containing protein [uncultured bacterium]|nr:MAG: pentapeptide repeat-containing protein [uncultured bacterium]
MNKNQKIIIDAIDQGIPLKTLKFSSDFNGFVISDYELEGINFKSSNFKSSKLTNIKFLNCSFNECLFEKSVFERCTFNNCSFKYTDFYDSYVNEAKFGSCEFNEIFFDKVKIENSCFDNLKMSEVTFYKSNLHSVKFIENNFIFCVFNLTDFKFVFLNLNKFEKGDFDNCVFENTVFSENNFNIMNYIKCNFLNLEWNLNELKKVNIISSVGIGNEIINEVVFSGGRTQTYASIILKNTLFRICSITFIIISTIIFSVIVFSNDYVYFRYIMKDSWNNIYKKDIINQTKVLFDITFKKRFLINNLNIAFQSRNNQNYEQTIEYLLKAYKLIPSSFNNYETQIWFVKEVLAVSNDEKKLQQTINTLEYSIKKEMVFDFRLYLIENVLLYNFYDSSLNQMQEFLLESDDNIDKISELVSVVSKTPEYLYQFKYLACQMLHSFLKRKIKRYPVHAEDYTYMLENVDLWYKYYEEKFN